MSVTRRDYILRMIEQLGDALARIASKRDAGSLQEADAYWRETADAIFGPLLSMIERLDTASAVRLLGAREKTYAYAALIDERAILRARRGELAGARADERRALELYLELASGGTVDDRVRAPIERLRASVDTGQLAPRYRDALRALSH